MAKDIISLIAKYNIRQADPAPGKTALLVVDMQEYFRSIAEPIIKNIISLTEVCLKKGVNVFYTRHGHRNKNDGSMLSRWWGDLIIYGSDEWKLIDKLNAPPESIIDKNRYNSFKETDLYQRLKSAGVNDIIITGVMTNCCVETTARSAFDQDLRVFIVADACASAVIELHTAALKNLAYGFAYIVDTEEMIGSLEM